MNPLEYLSIWYRSLLVFSISLFILSIYFLTLDFVIFRIFGSILVFISIIAIIFSFLGMFSVWPFGCDSRWPEIIPGKGGKLFPWKKALMFDQCISDNDCCQSYNIPMTCQGKNPDSGIPKICMPTKWNCKTSEGTGYNNCISGYSEIKNRDTGKVLYPTGSFGAFAVEVAPYIGAIIGGGIGFFFGGPLGAVAGGVGGDVGGAELASLLPGGGPGPGDKDYWGAGTDFKKITINVSGTYDTIQECENKCKTTLDSYKNSDFTKCQDYAKKYCKGTDVKDIKSCQTCLSKNQVKIDTCQPSGKKPDYAAMQKGESGCPGGDIWCGSGIEVDQAKCQQIVKQITDEEIQSMIDCPAKLKDNNICSSNTELTGDIKNCTNCIDKNIQKIEELGCVKNMTDRDKIILCNQMSYYYRI
jgi:hypothetical protein